MHGHADRVRARRSLTIRSLAVIAAGAGSAASSMFIVLSRVSTLGSASHGIADDGGSVDSESPLDVVVAGAEFVERGLHRGTSLLFRAFGTDQS